MMKLCIRFSVLLFLLSAGTLYAQHLYTFDSAIQSAAEQMELRLTRGSTVAILNITSPSQQLSNQVLSELTTRMANIGITVVSSERVAFAIEQAGILPDNISDVSMQSIGRTLGAQAVISGEADDMRDHYQMRFRMMNVETAAILAQPTFNVSRGEVVRERASRERAGRDRANRNIVIGDEWLFGGSFNLVRITGTDDETDRSFTFSPFLGYRFGRGGIGAFLSYNRHRQSWNEREDTTFSLGLFGDYNLLTIGNFSVLGRANLSYSWLSHEQQHNWGMSEQSGNIFRIGIAPIFEYRVFDNFALNASIGGISFTRTRWDDVDNPESRFEASIVSGIILGSLRLGFTFFF